MNHQIKILKRELPHGSAREIHKRMTVKGASYSYDAITAILRGTYIRQDVIDCAIEYLAEVKAKEKALAEANNNKIKHAIAS
ncbi:MAG: hypothetical protein GX879_11155 [Bacteroidales bacterium]|nr:hypothetical protein [Bacteroidales bacterium]